MFLVTNFGRELEGSKYQWDEAGRIFTSNENFLVLDFASYNNVTFRTGSECVFITGRNCEFYTGCNCTFNTGDGCVFTTGVNCFVTRYDVKGCVEIPLYQTIKLNGHRIGGYTVVEEPLEKKENIKSCNGKIVEIDGRKYKLVETY